MQRAIWKFPIQVMDRFEIAMPYEAEILCCQMQIDVFHSGPNKPYIWALVNPDAPTEVRKFRLAGTGHPILEPALTFVGTFQMAGGTLVFHLFEIEP